jgi:hypothetical protein
MKEVLMNIENELNLIKIRQTELMTEQRNYENMREMWRLQIVFEYLQDKYFMALSGNGQIH